MKKILNFLFVSHDDISLLVSADLRRRKILNFILMTIATTTSVLLVTLFILYVVLTGKILNEDLISIGTGCLIALVGIAFILFLNRYVSSRTASILLLLVVYVVIMSSDSLYAIVFGRSLIFMAMPVIIAAVPEISDSSN